MLAATVLTLVFVPVFYAVIEQWRERRPRSEPKTHAAPSEMDGPELIPLVEAAE
jgi:HAE1 family hydrophobic/amphiphilic exporter-1